MTEHEYTSPPPTPEAVTTRPCTPEELLERMAPRSTTAPPPTLIPELVPGSIEVAVDERPIDVADVVQVYSTEWHGPRAGIVVGIVEQEPELIVRVHVFLDANIDWRFQPQVVVQATVRVPTNTSIDSATMGFWHDGRWMQAIVVRRS